MKRHYLIYISLLLLLSIQSGIVRAQENEEKPKVRITVKHLPEAINTDSEELAPVISGDGKTLYFVRFESSSKGRQNIWKSTRANTNSPWSKAKKLPKPINNNQFNVICGTNEDGTQIFLTNSYTDSLAKGKYEGLEPGISVATFNKGSNSWNYPKPITFTPSLKEKKLAQSGHFYFHHYKEDKPNGKEFMLISLHDLKKPRLESYRDEEDIFVFEYLPQDNICKYIGDLGKTINTKVYETAPFLSKDGKKLYFTQHFVDGHKEDELYSTDAHIIEASMDLSNKNAKLNTTDSLYWENWKDVKYFSQEFDIMEGDPDGLNSDHFDAYLSLNNVHQDNEKVYGFFASARKSSVGYSSKEGALNKADIYEFIIDTLQPPKYTLIVKAVKCSNEEEGIVSMIEIATPNAESFDNKKATSILSRQLIGDNKVKGNFTVKVSAEGYEDEEVTFKMNVDQKNLTHTEVVCLNFRIPPPIQDSLLGELNKIVYFEFAKWDKIYTYPITSADSLDLINGKTNTSAVSLQSIVAELKDVLDKKSDLKILLRGHADVVDIDKQAATSNDWYSRKRAQIVKNYLLQGKNALDPNRVEIVTFGDTLPITDENGEVNTTGARARSRRVEIWLKDPSKQDE